MFKGPLVLLFICHNHIFIRACVSGSKFSKCMVGGAWVISIVAGIFFIVYSKGENKIYGCTIDIPDSWWKVRIFFS